MRASSDGTAARENETFEQYLAKRTGCSVSRLRTIFDDFLRDMFDRKCYVVSVGAMSSQRHSSSPCLRASA